jgi:outer membrane lipoprotein-sorting protein
MQDAYAALDSYTDTGDVVTYLGKKRVAAQTDFKTFFVRPDKYRFDCTRRHPYPPLHHIVTDCVVWYDGQVSKTYNSKRGVTIDEDITMSIAGATGVSSGSASTVSQLLIPVVAESCFLLADAETLEEPVFESVEGIGCWKLTVKQEWREDVDEVFLGAEDYLIRRISQLEHGVRIGVETHRDIVVNGLSSDDKIFRYEPPQHIVANPVNRIA